MARKKIVVVGAGNVGGEIAAQIARRELGNVVLLDLPEHEGLAKAKALDIAHECALLGADASVVGSGSWDDARGANVVFVAAGAACKPGQTRSDLLKANVPVIRAIAEKAREYCPEAGAIVVTNPVDVMAAEFKRITAWTRDRVLGVGSLLDTTRLITMLAEAAHVSRKDVRALVIGSHDSGMVPLLSTATIHGIPATRLLSTDTLNELAKRTVEVGDEIVRLQGTSGWRAPAAAAVHMVETIFRDSRRIVPCSVELEREYGGNWKGLFMGVPCILGKNGLERVVEVALDDQEKARLGESAQALSQALEAARKM